jgi:hypothetical protein
MAVRQTHRIRNALGHAGNAENCLGVRRDTLLDRVVIPKIARELRARAEIPRATENVAGCQCARRCAKVPMWPIRCISGVEDETKHVGRVLHRLQIALRLGRSVLLLLWSANRAKRDAHGNEAGRGPTTTCDLGCSCHRICHPEPAHGDHSETPRRERQQSVSVHRRLRDTACDIRGNS